MSSSRSASCSRPRISAPNSRPSCAPKKTACVRTPQRAAPSTERKKPTNQQARRRAMKTNPYLSFNGNCAEAFRFYEKVLGGKISALMTWADTPMANEMPAEARSQIVHARLQLDDNVLMGGD